MIVRKLTSTQLTAPGDGSTMNCHDVQASGGATRVRVQTIDTNVIVQNQYSDDAFTTTYYGDEKTITANGYYTLFLDPGFKQVKPVFVSEAGGVAAKVDFTQQLYVSN